MAAARAGREVVGAASRSPSWSRRHPLSAKRDLLTPLLSITDEAGSVTDTHRQIAESSDPHEVIDLTTRLRRRMMEGTGDIVRFTAAAAGANGDVGAAYVEGQARSRAGVGRVVARLVDERGWSADEAERWFTDVLATVLLESPRTG